MSLNVDKFGNKIHSYKRKQQNVNSIRVDVQFEPSFHPELSAK